MPFDRSKYPDNWEQVRQRVLRRAGGSDPDPMNVNMENLAALFQNESIDFIVGEIERINEVKR